jgi:predicted alpha/beta-fold hydrolase
VSSPLDPTSFRPRFPWWTSDLQTIANRSQDSRYMFSMARLLLDRGSRVLRLNLRGAGPSRAVCGQHYYAGRSQDFRTLLSILPKELTADGVVAVGYSLGGAMLLKYLGEEGKSAPLLAAASVSAPIDLAVTCRYMMRPRNRVYHRYILDLMKVEATNEGAVVSPEERVAIMGSGFASAEDYYERCRPTRFMAGIGIPTVVLAALDDPWIPGALYRGYDWTGNPSLAPVLTEHGGHVGFHGVGNRQPWSDLVVARFLERG